MVDYKGTSQLKARGWEFLLRVTEAICAEGSLASIHGDLALGGLPSSFHSFEVLVLVGSGGGESQLSSSVGSPHFGSRHRAGESPYWERESPGNACGFQM